MKHDLKLLLVAIVVIAIGYVGYNYIKTPYSTKGYQSLPEFSLKDLEGNKFTKNNIANNKLKFIMYYNSECEHCQHQAEQIEQHINTFKDIQLIFISYQDVSQIKEFAKKYHLELPNATFLEDPKMKVLSQFNVKGFPFMVIYSKDNQLLKKFEGPTKIDEILKYLQ